MLCCDLKDNFQLIDPKISAIVPTVSPLDRVVLSVFTPWLFLTGVAKPLFNGAALRAALLRRPCARLRANRREAMAVVLRGERIIVKINELLQSKLGCLTSSESLDQLKAAKRLG
jgi:hypothetical protein